MNISKTVSITAATRRTAAKQGIDVGADELRYLDNTLTPSERSAATKAALVAAPFAIGNYKVANMLTATVALDMSYQKDPCQCEQRLAGENFDLAKLPPAG